MTHLFSNNYLTRTPIENAVKDFAANFTSDQVVVDIGCGDKPYQHYFKATYIGVDPFPPTESDIKANAWDIPLDSGSADGVILTQSLEHIQKTEATVKEIYRLLKPGGLVLVTAPQTMRVHSLPLPLDYVLAKHVIPPTIASVWKEDYYRFTKYGLLYLFRRFQPLVLRETRTTFSTIAQQFNYFAASLGLRALAGPIYCINNLVGIAADGFFSLVRRIPLVSIQRFDELVVRGLTTDYVFVGKKG